MNKQLHQAYDPNTFRQQGHQLVDRLADYLEQVYTNDKQPVSLSTEPEEALNFWRASIEQTGEENLMDWYGQVIDRSIHLHHPHYMGHQISPPVPVAALAALLSDLLNNGMGVFEMGRVGTAMEQVVIEKVAQQFGMTERAGGFLTSGGTLANLTALLSARQSKAPGEVWTEGNSEQLAVMVSEEAHYCVDRAARIMGLGSKGIIKIPAGPDYRMKTELLEEYWQKARAEGLHPIALVGSACSTSTGAYDNLEAIGDFCKEKNLWFHVDGAHGAAAAFSKKYQVLVKGIASADSVVMDFHKMLMTPALATALVFRNYEDSFATFSQRAQYLWESAEEQEWFNLARRTFECTKNMMSLKVFSILKTYGTDLLEEYVSHCYDLGIRFAQMIRERSQLELATFPDCNIVCFRLLTGELNREALNRLNASIRKKIIHSGEFYIVQTALRGNLYLRVTLTNPFTTEKDLALLLDRVEAA